jgi:hypothetical protein
VDEATQRQATQQQASDRPLRRTSDRPAKDAHQFGIMWLCVWWPLSVGHLSVRVCVRVGVVVLVCHNVCVCVCVCGGVVLVCGVCVVCAWWCGLRVWCVCGYVLKACEDLLGTYEHYLQKLYPHNFSDVKALS